MTKRISLEDYENDAQSARENIAYWEDRATSEEVKQDIERDRRCLKVAERGIARLTTKSEG